LEERAEDPALPDMHRFVVLHDVYVPAAIGGDVAKRRDEPGEEDDAAVVDEETHLSADGVVVVGVRDDERVDDLQGGTERGTCEPPGVIQHKGGPAARCVEVVDAELMGDEIAHSGQYRAGVVYVG